MLVPIERMQCEDEEDEEDARLLGDMAERARKYITSFHWCLPIQAMYLAYGVGGVIALFLVVFEGKIGGTDDKLWVVVGDLPPAYMVVEPEDSAQDALEGYCLLMDDWVAAVRGDAGFENVFPVTAERTEKHVSMLERRLALLRKEIIPEASADPVTNSNDEIIT